MVFTDIIYSSEGCGLDLYLPEEKNPPLYVYIHGGGLSNGDKSNVTVLCNYLCDHGVAVASLNYRLYPEAKYPDYITDCAEGIRFLLDRRAQYGFSDLFVGGSSAGAYIAMMLFFNKKFLGDAGVPEKTVCGYIFDAGQPTTHFNYLNVEKGMDSRRVLIDETAPLYYISEDFTPEQPRIRINYAEYDMVGRPEQLAVLYRTMLAFRFPEEKLSMVCYEGQKHCRYLGMENYLRDTLTFIRNGDRQK